MSGSEQVRQQISSRVGRGDFLVNLLHVAQNNSDDVQAHFVAEASKLTVALREILERYGMLRHVQYSPTVYWPAQKGKTYGFIDGGVANIEIPTAAPVGIRVGSYVVRPGDESDAREEFAIELALVDDLYSAESTTYDPDADPFEDTMKLRDAARIIAESAAALRLASRSQGRPDGILVHGPLINPAAPYALDGHTPFPPFTLQTARIFLGDDGWRGEGSARVFVALQLEVLNALMATKVPVVGVVERASAKNWPVLESLLTELTTPQGPGKLRQADAQLIRDIVKAFALSDTSVFDLLLREGEYLSPVAVNRQGAARKWPRSWEDVIANYPDALTTYVKPTDTSQPFRVEGFCGTAGFEEMISLVMHTSRLLPSYAFPVGLDIADRFSKVPAWMSAGVRARHQVMLLRKALESRDPRMITYAKRVMASKGRDWLFRPTI